MEASERRRTSERKPLKDDDESNHDTLPGRNADEVGKATESDEGVAS